MKVIRIREMSTEPENQENPEASTPLPTGVDPRRQRMLASMSHAGAVATHFLPFVGLVIPLYIWFRYRHFPLVRNHSIQAINFILTSNIVYSIAWISATRVPAAETLYQVIDLIIVWMAAWGAFNGSQARYFRYPLTHQFVG